MKSYRQKLRTAFTLAEMLVVLVILALLAFVAVESLRPLANQARFDATRTTLENLRRAIIGDPNSGDASGVRGFVADTGRFPNSLDELVVPPPDFDPTTLGGLLFQLRSAPGIYSGISVPTGWRGPYLIIPPGANSADYGLKDGWGLTLQPQPPNLLVPDSLGAYQISSAAAGHADAAPEYAVDLTITIRADEWRPTLITGTLYRLDGVQKAPPTATGTWGVAVLGPGPLSGPNAVPGGVQIVPASVQVNAGTGDVTYSLAGGISGNLTCGPRVVQATRDGAIVGRPVYVHLQGGGTHVIDLKVE